MLSTRHEWFTKSFPDQPAYRWNQIESALFDPAVTGWEGISTLPKEIKASSAGGVPWMSVSENSFYKSSRGDTFKALLATPDGLLFETVLMANRRDLWTICVSSQIGCAMGCTFCATGKMGLKRSLTSDEIIDQYRYWKKFLLSKPELPQRISNIVFMGMGEPLHNYENVKAAIHTWLRRTDLGPTRITVSSVGLLSQLEKILEDPDWPGVRIAISLHSADPVRRKSIVPTTVDDFLPRLAEWARNYFRVLGNRRHHITYEYTLLNGVNDSEAHAEGLAQYILTTHSSKINVIPYNPVPGQPFSRSRQDQIDRFKAVLLSHNIDVTQRRTMGEDIAAACGQLATAV